MAKKTTKKTAKKTTKKTTKMNAKGPTRVPRNRGVKATPVADRFVWKRECPVVAFRKGDSVETAEELLLERPNLERKWVPAADCQLSS